MSAEFLAIVGDGLALRKKGSLEDRLEFLEALREVASTEAERGFLDFARDTLTATLSRRAA